MSRRTLSVSTDVTGRVFADPHAGVRAAYEEPGDVELRADVVVVGSGPAGALVAKELAEAGRDVVLLEEGRAFGKKDMVTEAGTAMHRLLRESGTRVAMGSMYVPTMQAIALGGGSLINSAICARTPEWVFEKWHRATGVDIPYGELEKHYERVEKFLFVAPTPMEAQGERNLRFKRGCDALGISSEPTWRNVEGCLGSSECFTGCRNGAKKSTDITYVPAAIEAGARVLTGARVRRVMRDGRRAVGVEGIVVDPATRKEVGTLRVHAATVVLAAGCMQSPVILQRSEMGGRWVGRELQLHPGLAIMALFDDPIDPWKGATQGFHSLEYLREGIKLEVLWSPPAVLAARLPGLGHAYQEALAAYDRMAPFDVIIAADRSRGSVRARRTSDEPDIRFEFDKRDVRLIQRGLGVLSDICWASGAQKILPGLHGVPEVLESREESEVLRTADLEGQHTITAANHAFGTTRMAARPEDGVVDAWGKVWDTDGLFVADTGIFAGSPAVNPMLTCMALADRIAHGIAAST